MHNAKLSPTLAVALAQRNNAFITGCILASLVTKLGYSSSKAANTVWLLH